MGTEIWLPTREGGPEAFGGKGGKNKMITFLDVLERATNGPIMSVKDYD